MSRNKNIIFQNYRDSVEAIISARPDKDSEDCNEVAAYYIDQMYELGEYDKGTILNDTHASRERAIYGVRFRDTGSGYAYGRTGSLEEFSAGLKITDDRYLPVHRRMRRCVLTNNGKVKHYLDPEDSMWIKNSPVKDNEASEVEVVGVDAPHNENNAIVTINGIADIKHIGCTIKLSDDPVTREWYGIIIGAEGNDYIVSNPLIIGWGTDPSDNPCTVGHIGDAKLDGSHGQVMVDTPGFWHRHMWEEDTSGMWQRHDVSLRPFGGAGYNPRRFISAFEGVQSDNTGAAVNGWHGTWDPATNTWGSIDMPSLTNALFMSVAGFYPRTSIARYEIRPRAVAVGNTYHQYGFYDNKVMQILMITEYADMNTQRSIGPGVANFTGSGIDWNAYNGYYPIRRTGDTIRAGNRTWDMSTLGSLARMQANGDAVYTIQSLSYRGIENPWGHIWKWVDGINFRWEEPEDGISFAYAHVTDDPDLFSDTVDEGHVKLPDRMESAAYENDKWVNKNRYWRDPSPDLLPTTIKPSNASFVGDYSYFPSGAPSSGHLRILAVGGHAYSASFAGAFSVYSRYGSSARDTNFGGRLCSKSDDTPKAPMVQLSEEDEK